MGAGNDRVLRGDSRLPLPVGIELESLIVKTSGTLNSAFTENWSPCNLKAFRGQSPALSTAWLILFFFLKQNCYVKSMHLFLRVHRITHMLVSPFFWFLHLLSKVVVGRLCRQANCVFRVLAALHCETKCAKPLEDVTQLNICLVKYFFFSNVNLKVVSVCIKAGSCVWQQCWPTSVALPQVSVVGAEQEEDKAREYK